METIKFNWKQFVVWGTDLWHKYQKDLFFRTTLHVVALQLILVIISVTIFAWTLHYTNQKVINTTISRTASLILNYPTQNGQTLSSSIDAIQNQSIKYVLASIVSIAVIFGIALAYITLRPTRDSLSYQKLFISNIAHELRTPLSTIKTSTEVTLLDETLSQGTRKTLIEVVEELDRISEIINNLLSLNTLLRPEKMEFSIIDLGSIVDASVGRLRELASNRNIEIILKKSDYRIVWGNATALEQVVTNIVRNAISYTPKDTHGIITISVHPDYHGSIMCMVADKGIGISQKDLFHIFEPFYRADLSRTRNIKKSGSGLGLAIVSEIIRVHHGKIHIQSGLSKGTTISITLPSATYGNKSTSTQEVPSLNEVSVDFSKQV